MNFYVYAYYDKNDPEGKPFYIGKGKGRRCLVHLDKCHTKNTLFYNKLRKMLATGNVPIVRFLAQGLTDDEAIQREIELIAKHGRRDNGTGCLCNHTDGGEGQAGRIASDKARQNLDKTGQELSIDTRIRMSRARVGRRESAETRQRKREARHDCLAVCSYDLKTGETIKTYPSIGSARDDGYSPSLVSQVVRRLRRHHGGVGWRTA